MKTHPATRPEARTFQNPVIPGFHPDPSVCRVGDDFYLVTSSFEYFPGVPIFHSRDLIHWSQVGHVLTRASQLDLRRMRSSGGIYAPTLRHRRGRYYVVTTNVGGGGHFYVTAKRPEGPWSEPTWLDDEGIDPSLLFDGETVYYTRDGKGPDFDHPLIYQAKIDIETGKVDGKPRPIWAGTGGIWPEGAHLYKIGTTYYLMTAEGGTGYDHSEVIARSSTPFGPFDAYPGNPILSHRHRRKHPIQATGHADLVELADGTWWAVLLGIRPKSGRHHHLGRETFLAPVTWTRDGWPVIGDRGRIELEMAAPRLPSSPAAAQRQRDDFDRRELSLEWNFLRNPSRRDWSLGERPGHLRLLGSRVTLDEVDSPALVVRSQQHFDVRCRAALEFSPRRANEEAGMTVRANEDFHYDLAVGLGQSGREAVLRRRVRGQSRVVHRLTLREGPLELEVRASEDRYLFSAGAPGRLQPLGSLPTKALSAESIGAFRQSYFTGTRIGLYATGNGSRSTVPADFDWFDYAPVVQ
ncbi:MAG TPA: glycoside hydrolase family 43 protein [Polyangiaceae bacterium]|nr:glycoside hydrolase family 43 protein [Polyangiaceae bacterium]